MNQWLLSPVDLYQVEGDIHCKQVEIMTLASHLDLHTQGIQRPFVVFLCDCFKLLYLGNVKDDIIYCKGV